MSFIGKFFLLVLVVGTSELYLLVQVAAQLTFPVTLAVCILTGMLGGALVRHQGLRTLGEIQRMMARGQVPTEEIVSGLMLLVVGSTLILPGFVSDTVGFLLLVPPLRARVSRWLIRRFQGRINLSHFGPMAGGGEPPPTRGRVIDVEPD